MQYVAAKSFRELEVNWPTNATGKKSDEGRANLAFLGSTDAILLVNNVAPGTGLDKWMWTRDMNSAGPMNASSGLGALTIGLARGWRKRRRRAWRISSSVKGKSTCKGDGWMLMRRL